MVSPEDLMIPGLSPGGKSSRSSTNPFDNESIGEDPVDGVPHSDLTDSVADNSETKPAKYSMRGGMISGNVIDAEEEHLKKSKKDDVESGSFPPDSDYASRGPKSLWDASTVGYSKRKGFPGLSLPIPRNNDDDTDVGKRRKYLRFLVGVTVVVLVLAIVAVFVLLRNTNTDGDKDPRQSAIDDILNSLSTTESLSTKGTPQSRAREWLIHHDAMQLNPLANTTHAQVAQRYTLATFYFSTGGDSTWIANNWLTGDECDSDYWNFIDCDDNQQVRAMVFGQF